MGKGGTRRSRYDENAITNASARKSDAENVAKRTKGPEQERKEYVKKGRGRRRSRGKTRNAGTPMGSALHPINFNSVSVPTDKSPKDRSTNCTESGAVSEMTRASEAAAAAAVTGFTSRSCTPSPDAALDRTFIWSNAAFCSDLVVRQSISSVAGAALPESKNPESECQQMDENNDADVVERQRESSVHFVEPKRFPEDTRQEILVTSAAVPVPALPVEEEEAEKMEEEIQKEIEALTRRLTELRERREARHASQERSKRALSCPPTPIAVSKSDHENRGTPDSKSKCRKGRMVSAKFLQGLTKSPAVPSPLEPKTADKKLPKPTTTPLSQHQQHHPERSSGSSDPHVVKLTPKPPVKPQVKSNLPHPLSLKKNSSSSTTGTVTGTGSGSGSGAMGVGEASRGGSLDGTVVEQMRALSLSPGAASGIWSAAGSSKRFDWTKTLRCSDVHTTTAATTAATSTATAAAATAAAAATSTEVAAAVKGSNRKVRSVPSRYTSSDHLLLQASTSCSSRSSLSSSSSSSRKRSLDPQEGVRKRASPEQLYRTPPSGKGMMRMRMRMKKDELEIERNKLPKINISNKESEYVSPRDSGCIKRVSQQKSSASRTPFFIQT